MCFPLGWVEQVLIWIIVIGAVWAILRLLVPFILSQLGLTLGSIGTIVMRILWIVFIAIVLVALVVFAFDLIACLIGSVKLR
jgi:flagellar biosynthesis protein FlhB